MNKYENLNVKKTGAIVEVEIDRKDGRNALSIELMKELTSCAHSIKVNTEVQCVILSGQGDSFSVGADLKDTSMSEFSKTSLQRREMLKTGPDMCQAWESLEQITIASIEGYCIGGALALAVSCDFRVASKGAIFRLPEIPLGMNMSWQSIPRLNALIGPAATKELVILGEEINGTTAFDWHLTQRLANKGESKTTSLEIAKKVEVLPPLPVRMSKISINAVANALNYTSSFMDRDQFQLTSLTEDQREAIKSFFEKRDGKFKGE